MEQIMVERRGVMTGHKDCVYTLEPSPQSNIFFSAAGDGMIVQWDVNNMDEGKLLARVPNSVYALHFIKKYNLLAIGHNYDGVHFVDYTTAKEVASLQCTEGAIFDMTSFENKLFIGDSSGELTVVDIEKLEVIESRKYSGKSLRSIAFNHDHTELALGYSDNVLRILDSTSLKVKAELNHHTNSIFTVSYSPDGHELMSAGRDAHLIVRSAKSNYTIQHDIIAHMYAVNNIVFSPDGKHFVTCSMDKSIKIWEAETHKLVKVIDKARHAGHGTSVNKLLWLKYDNLLLSASDDRTISAWKLEFN